MEPSTDLVLSLCRVPLAEAELERASAAIAAGPDWDSFFVAAAGLHVEPVVLSNLRESLADDVPRAVLERAADAERNARVLALSRTLMLVNLSDRMKSAGIDTIVLKGPTISIAAYGDASLRTFADADFLVRRHDMPAARDLLLGLGYEREYEPAVESRLLDDQHALEFISASLKAELHASLISRHLRFEMNADAMWRRSVMVPCGGSSIRSLAVPEMFLYLCAHGAKHEWQRLSWIADIAQLAARMSDDEARSVLELARSAHGIRLVTLALHLAGDILGGVPTPLGRFFPTSTSVTQRLVDDVVTRLGLEPRESVPVPLAARMDPRLRPLVFWTRSRERRIDRVACLARVLFVPTESDSGPRLTRWFTRPARLAIRALRNTVSAAGSAA
jgi:hypothetical protein